VTIVGVARSSPRSERLPCGCSNRIVPGRARTVGIGRERRVLQGTPQRQVLGSAIQGRRSRARSALRSVEWMTARRVSPSRSRFEHAGGQRRVVLRRRDTKAVADLQALVERLLGAWRNPERLWTSRLLWKGSRNRPSQRAQIIRGTRYKSSRGRPEECSAVSRSDAANPRNLSQDASAQALTRGNSRSSHNGSTLE